MELIIDIIIEFIIVFIFRYPGAGIRWLISRIWNSKKKFSDFLNDAIYLNAIVALLTLTAIILTIK